jgi:hypothetical protein
MPVTVTAFEEKKYIIDGAEFKLKKPTLGIKRRGASLASILILKIQELSAISEKYLRDAERVKASDAAAYRELCEVAEQLNKINEEVFTKAEELFNLVLEPVKQKDITKLVADNIDTDVLTQVINDFFQLAGLSTQPANR